MFRAEIEILDVYEKCMALSPAPATMRSKARHGQSGHLVFLVYSTLEEATQVLLNKVITLEGCDYKVFAARESSQEQKRNKAIAAASFREAEDTLRYQQQLKAADPMVVAGYGDQQSPKQTATSCGGRRSIHIPVTAPTASSPESTDAARHGSGGNTAPTELQAPTCKHTPRK